MTDFDLPTLHVCITCLAGQPIEDPRARPGALLFDAIGAALAGTRTVHLHPTSCLAACERGCTAALSMPGRFSYLLGHLAPAYADDLLDYARSYARSPTGTVMPSRRAASLKNVVLGRIPSLTNVKDTP